MFLCENHLFYFSLPLNLFPSLLGFLLSAVAILALVYFQLIQLFDLEDLGLIRPFLSSYQCLYFLLFII